MLCRIAYCLLEQVPYLYTAGRFAYDHAVAAVHPLYYDYADTKEAFTWASSQYLLGEALMVCSICRFVYQIVGSFQSLFPGITGECHLYCDD
jgi:alpha-glucosidase (family GH31 glycosyl hydrolase)